MGMTSALKLKRVVENAEMMLAIELMTAAQGLDYRVPLKAGREIEQAKAMVRGHVPRLAEDRVLALDIETLSEAIRAGEFDRWKQ